MIRDALADLYAEFFGVTTLSQSMEAAVNDIVTANAETDEIGNQIYSAYHFDGENLGGGQDRLVNLFRSIEANLKDHDPSSARRLLGGALHTLQDFYSHSTHVERNSGDGSSYSKLGLPGTILTATSEEDTCDTCNDRNSGKNCSDGQWNIDCSENLNTPIGLTTGYFGLIQDRVKPNCLYNCKCSHGGFWDTSSFNYTGGINKDTNDICRSPHYFYHSQAAAAAKQSTKEFIRALKQDMAYVPKLMRTLLGVTPTLAVALDLGSSMSTSMEQVKQEIIREVESRENTFDEPSLYVVALFNDALAFGPFTWDAGGPFVDWVRTLQAVSGGECPVWSMSAMLMALEKSGPGDLFVFTNASAKDPELADKVVALALAKDIQITVFSLGSCGSLYADTIYEYVANQSGGYLINPLPT